MNPGSDFPTDETTLTLLIASCQINPDTGQTHLQDFLDMGSRVKSVEQIEWSDPPVFMVEHEPGYEPFSEQQVIIALARELRELRARLAVAEAYIPSRDYEDYRGDADREVGRP